MKTLMIIAIVALAVSSPFVTRADEAAHLGSYQLLYAVTETVGHGITMENKTVWKIDTVTRQVWKFVSVRNDKGLERDSFQFRRKSPSTDDSRRD